MTADKLLLKKIQRVQKDILRCEKALDYAYSQGENIKKMPYVHEDGTISTSGITMQERLNFLKEKISFWDTIHV